MSENLTKKRLLSVACHASIFLTATLVSVGIPLAIYIECRGEDPRLSATG
ncbi:MAG: hypothetical protein ACKO8H_16100 [Microcystis panniformis]